ncbi:hypothetical protein FNJ47_29050 [Bradyrhizobium sp. UFLA 03-164]|uniref:AsnC family protein n=1 Tax=Bradyrhizobium uaiense TaxID=2594946 RepID=A0A6P1BMJ1_9BRAD|nr:hypothetical protein [Bradyrhizobium uaiense]
MPAKQWSDEDEQRLLQMIRETAMTQRDIAHVLGRTEAAVSSRLSIIRKRGSSAARPRGTTPSA